MTSKNIGIVCPECNGNLRAKDKERRGQTIRHRYVCGNVYCPAKQRRETVVVYTIERIWMTCRRPDNSTSRMKRSKIPAIDQTSMEFDGQDPKIESARK